MSPDKEPIPFPPPVNVAGIRPRGDQVLLRRLRREEQTPGGILLPDEFKNDFFMAEVLAIGPGGYDGGKRCPPDDLAVGDIVMVDEDRRDPQGFMHRHCIPVTPREKDVVLVLEIHIRAINPPAA